MPNDDARAALSGRTYRFIRRVPHVSGDGGIVLCAPCDGFGEDGDGDGRLRYVTEYEWRTGCKERDRRIRETGSRNDEAGASCGIPAASGDSGASGVPPITARSSSADKIALFRSLFRGRDDVYAHGFVNAKTGKMGYAVAAWNEWTELADGKRVPTPPERRRCKPLSDQALVAHFTGRDPKRDDGLQPIAYMQCGPIRHIVDVKDQMVSQRFSRILIPRFTPMDFRLPERVSYHDYLEAACDNDERNRMIIDDTMDVIAGKGTPLLLTKRVEHAKRLAESLRERGCRHVVLLHGSDPKAIRRRNLEAVRNVPDNEDLAIVATGSYIGEGFDCGRLDTLMLAAPVSVEGAVAQYVGRLHRDNAGKREVRVYDYIDVTVPMSAAMYRKRLKAYAHQGYAANILEAKTQRSAAREQAIRIQRGRASDSPMDATQGGIVFAAEFGEALRADINACEHAIEITAEYTTAKAVDSLGTDILKAIGRGVRIHVTLKLGANATPAARARTERSMHRLTAWGCTVSTAETCTEHAVFDDELIWFGSLPLLGNPKDDDCSLRFRDSELAAKLARRSLEP